MDCNAQRGFEIYLGRDGGSPFLVELAQRQEGVHLFFIFRFLLPSMKESFLRS